jgi:hypothetical protein
MLGTEVVIAKSAPHDDLIVSKLIVHDTQKSGGQSRERDWPSGVSNRGPDRRLNAVVRRVPDFTVTLAKRDPGEREAGLPGLDRHGLMRPTSPTTTTDPNVASDTGLRMRSLRLGAAEIP